MPVSSGSAMGDGACEILASGCGMSSILPGEGGGEVTAGRGRVCQRGRRDTEARAGSDFDFDTVWGFGT